MHSKVFIWKILVEAISMGVRTATRGLGSEVCKGCKIAVESLVHLFMDSLLERSMPGLPNYEK